MEPVKSKDEQQFWRRHLIWMVLFIIAFGIIYKTIDNKNLWLWYAVVYTAAVLVMGTYVIFKRKDRSIRLRTASLMFFQLFLYFLFHRFYVSKELGKAAGYPWPLNITSLYPHRPDWVLAYVVILTFIILPILTYFYGRRAYCGWICSCGAIAETLGDPFRKRAPKGKMANKLEIGMYTVLLIATITTVYVWLGGRALHFLYASIVSFYIAGILAMGIYPFMGGRIWCRYFCPTAAILGAISKRGKFAVTGDFDKCIKCGICTQNCQMGIDIRSLISSGKKVKNDQCVGCGICVSLCPVKILWFEGGLTRRN
ncbi:MAG: 4Fe-4S binding protein [Candidatus Hydrothermarchaeaceae archaeon]